MIIQTMKFKDEDYNLRLTNAAKIKIEALQKEKLKSLGKGDALKLISKQERLKLELAREKDETKREILKNKLDEVNVDVAPHLLELMEAQNEDDYLEIPWILISSDHHYKDKIKKEDFDEMLLLKEDEMGFTDFNKWLIEISEKVFTEIRGINELKQEKLGQKEKEPETPQLMN